MRVRFRALAGLFVAAGILNAQNVHPLAQPRFDQGTIDANFRLSHIKLTFQQTASQRADLDQLLAAQRDPSSPEYNHWLTPEQYGDRFGLNLADLARVRAWLTSAGFTIDYAARGRDWIAFSGTAAQVEAALHTSVHRYAIGGESHFALATEPVIPSELKPFTAGLLGLDDFRPRSMAKPGYTSGSGYSLAPGDLATIYDINPLYQQGLDGSNQKIVIVGQAAVNMTDIQQFRNNYGLGAAKIKLVSDGTQAHADPGDLTEADLDLEWAGAIAPNVSLIYVYGADADQAAFYAIDQNFAPIVSESFGLCEADTPPTAVSQFEAEAKKANSMGITWIAASGDSGAAGCDYGGTVASRGLAVSFPASVPEVTAVGATEFNEGNGVYSATANGTHGGSALGYIPEMAWNDTNPWFVAETGPMLASTGGGVSTFYAKPSWQAGPGVPADGQRDVPDIALVGSNDHDPYNVISGGQNQLVGGTSAAAPVFAGMLALLNQHLQKGGVGNINASVYGLALSSPSMFHDVINNSNIVPCEDGSPNCVSGTLGYAAGIGYDLTTGLGSVDTANLVNGWSAALSGGATPVISSIANAASYIPGVVVPGEMVVISGTGLGPAQLGGMQLTGAGTISTQYTANAMIKVLVNGVAAPLMYASSTAVAVMVPYETTGSAAQVTVTYQGTTSAAFTVKVAPSAPGVFTANASGQGQAAAVNYGPNVPNSAANPATPGSTIVLYETGEGQTSPGGMDGTFVKAPLPAPVLPVSVTIGGVPAVVQYAGGAAGKVAGMMQLDVVVPAAVSGSALPVVVQVGNAISQSGVTVAVAPGAGSGFAMTSQETSGSIVTGLTGALTCSAPAARSSFASTESRVWTYFSFTGAQYGDVISSNWVHPSGQVDSYQPTLTLTHPGTGCAAVPLAIAGGAGAQDPGNWQVEVFRNGTLEFTLPFTITP
jgi:uncharacterized protein (TIGR03437 family)